jgi:hypothetical protein
MFQLAAPVVGAAIAELTSIGFVLAVFGVGLAIVGVLVILLRPQMAPDADALDTSAETSAA